MRGHVRKRGSTWTVVYNESPDEHGKRADYLDSIFDLPENARERLVREVLEFSAPTTRVLRRWGANSAALIEDWERRVTAAGFELPEERPES